ncbi:MAG: non-ribosomal peptide synthetase, partial [bacterium]|nr:non-ribosomal peptide synthetase [bacterium]
FVSRLQKEMNIRLPLEELFRQPHIRGLSSYIKSISQIRGQAPDRNKHVAIPVVETKEYYPLSPQQQQLYILYQLAPESTVYNLPTVVELKGHPNHQRFEAAFGVLMNRHESLRTSFETIDNEPAQRVRETAPLNILFRTVETGNESHIEKEIDQLVCPFNPARAPLIRIALLKLEETRHLLFIDMHHIITDGLSQGILRDEFLALRQDPSAELPPLRIQYKDYSLWQSLEKNKTAVDKQKDHWLREFSNPRDLPVLNLPTDYPRPEIKRFDGDQIVFALEAGETQKLESALDQQDVTLYMYLLASMNILMSKLSGQEDIIIGSSIAGRRNPDLEHIIGMFVNTLALRNYPDGNKTFDGFLREVKKCTLTAFENQEYPFEELVNQVSEVRHTGRNPLFDIMLTMEDIEAVETGTGSAAAATEAQAERGPYR